MLEAIMRVDATLQYPCRSATGGIGDFNNLVIKNWARCDIAGRIVEDGASRNLITGMQTGGKHRTPSNNNMSLIMMTKKTQ